MQSPAQSPLNPIEGDHSNGLGYFLGCFFHFLALITLIEYTQSGTTTFASESIVQFTLQAEYIFSLLHNETWRFRRTSLFTALSLLLTSVLGKNEKGEFINTFPRLIFCIAVMTCRQWLRDVWLAESVNNCRKLSDCTSSLTNLVESFWQRDITRDEYKEILSKNSWIWRCGTVKHDELESLFSLWTLR